MRTAFLDLEYLVKKNLSIDQEIKAIVPLIAGMSDYDKIVVTSMHRKFSVRPDCTYVEYDFKSEIDFLFERSALLRKAGDTFGAIFLDGIIPNYLPIPQFYGSPRNSVYKTLSQEELPSQTREFPQEEVTLCILSQTLLSKTTPGWSKGIDFEEFDSLMQNYVSSEATRRAEDISKKYKINVVILETDAEYYSDSTIQMSAENDLYFVSRENPKATGDMTEYLLRFYELKTKYLIDHPNEIRKHALSFANEIRSEKSNQKASLAYEEIEKIKFLYRETHKGKDPSFHTIAEMLNKHQIQSPGGKPKWYAQTVKRALEKGKPKTNQH